jgi:Pentapeptide repeats (8 copies)
MTDIRKNLPRILAEHREWRMGDGGRRDNLNGADLSSANLRDANLSDADLVDGGQRSDGYRFVGWVKNGILMISAGCRNLTMPEYREHNAKRENIAMRAETSAILDHIETVARIRNLIAE